jgi:hypothetical protein
MNKFDSNPELTRRRLLQLSAATAATFAMPRLAAAVVPAPTAEHKLYSTTLQSWCDGLLAHQITNTDPALNGGLLCPACALIHGRCGDAVYPLLRVAHTTGQSKYLHAALAVHEWSERNVSRDDGSWVNDVTLSTWKGITVFKTIALCEAVHHHGAILPVATRKQWIARIARAAKFLDGFINIQTGNINYPITSTLAFTLCAQVLNELRYLDRAKKLAHEALANFTPAGLLFGEGHPFDVASPKGCHPVDLGYNIEESLPALALYATLTNDKEVLDVVVKSLRTHLEFMLPDGGWDNSWGTRNYKWSYWGSRTSDGCQPAFVLLAEHVSPDIAVHFREAAHRNLQLMAACTHNNLLYGGPDYFAHGDLPCIHHAFTHAKALATVLDRGAFPAQPATPQLLPREEPYGVKSFLDIATHLVSIGDWRATVTDYDWEYVETVQAGGGGNTGGGHASGGALTMLYHQKLGPILTASMNQYSLIEISNQQQFNDKPHMTLTPRIELIVDGKTYTSLVDLKAKLTVIKSEKEIVFVAEGQLLTTSHQSVPGEGVRYQLTYRLNANWGANPLNESECTITAKATGKIPGAARLIVPLISSSTEHYSHPNPLGALFFKKNGALQVTTDAAQGFEPIRTERTFNLVPGFECVPLSIVLEPNTESTLKLSRFYAY